MPIEPTRSYEAPRVQSLSQTVVLSGERRRNVTPGPSRARISRVILVLLLFVCWATMQSAGAHSRCRIVEQPAQVAPKPAPLATATFVLSEDSEVAVEIEARSVGASWARRDAEAAALTISIDDKYSSDLLLWMADEIFTYRAMLGRLPRGRHKVDVRLNPARSARGAQKTDVTSLRALPGALPRDSLSVTDLDLIALARSPVLYARANAIDRFTDVPLVMYYETARDSDRDLRVRYTVIFSHEDGGTPTAALLARWGRATDIEWVYEFAMRDGKVVDERYQGVEHETKPFAGRRFMGQHPLLGVASDNNNFSDLACSDVRYALLPVRAQLDSASRERVMDDAPWTYRVMAEELARERRINDTPGDANQIADPRAYLYTEVYAEQQGTAMSLEARVAGAATIFSSDIGDPRLRVDRSGYFRIATQLPPDFTPATLDSITVRCHDTPKQSDSRMCDKVKLSKVFMLDREFVPRELRIAKRSPIRLRPGEAGIFRLML